MLPSQLTELLPTDTIFIRRSFNNPGADHHGRTWQVASWTKDFNEETIFWQSLRVSRSHFTIKNQITDLERI